ncbi:MAG TPA: PPC domain-containing protein [Pirellulales bacterium]|nr:PPC domain-containing protein [Pirellulales bacterium]
MLLFLGLPSVRADDPKPDPKSIHPNVKLTNPLGLMPGIKTKVLLRGQKLDQATAIKIGPWPDAAKILKKEAAPQIKPFEPDRVGDQQLEVEITLPIDAFPGGTHLVVVTPEGETPPRSILIDPPGTLVSEREPNNSFREAQPLALGQTMQGTIQQPQDIDLFRYEGRAGEQVAFEIVAARQGSALDSLLMLFDHQQHLLAVNDDTHGSRDSLIEITLPADGPYFLSLQDAQDLGGNSHPYRLQVRSSR